MKKTLITTIRYISLHRGRLFGVFVVVFVLSALQYGYSVHSTIMNVVERDTMAKEMRGLSTRVTALESRYFTKKNAITLDLAYTLGFKNPATTHYIAKKGLGKVVALRNEL